MQSRPAGENITKGRDARHHVPAVSISRLEWCLESLHLLSVQPACLPIFSRQLPDSCLSVSKMQRLLVQLQADLVEVPEGLGGQHAPDHVVAATGLTVAAGNGLKPPVLVSQAVLQLSVLANSTQELLQRQFNLQQLLCQQQPQVFWLQGSDEVTCDDSSSIGIRHKLQVNLSIDVQKPESSGCLDVLHLLVLVQQQQQQKNARPVLVAAVPLLLMPAAAQQEVQQLLLPAMRQDAQAALIAQQQQQQQQQQIEEQAMSSKQGASSLPQLHLNTVMQVEAAVWKHFCQLAQDIFLVWQLSTGAAALVPAAAGTEPSAAEPAGQASPSVVEGTKLDRAGSGSYSSSLAVLELTHPKSSSGSPGAATIELLAATLLFPVLLPFLAGHGLCNTLNLVLDCLPIHLQQQWTQQQLSRLQTLMAAAADHEDLQDLLQHADGAQPHVGCTSSSIQSTKQLEAAVADLGKVDELKGERDVSGGAGGDVVQGTNAGSPTATSATQAIAESTASPAAAAAVAGEPVPWYLPLVGFNPEEEVRYLDWKHQTLLHLDYFAGVFCMCYLAVLVRKMLTQPSTVYYLLYILIKTLPHVPLMMGFRSSYLRFRELWLFLVAPTCMVMVCVVAHRSVHVGDVPSLVFTKALQAYWRSRGEVSTSVLRPFLQHMRLRPYIWYVVLDAAMSVWVFGQVYGYTAAASRWGVAAGLSTGLCWGLELYTRRLFVNRQQQQTQHTTVAAATDSSDAGVALPIKNKSV